MNPRLKLLILSILLAGVVGWAFAPATYDDGYITYRYAHNLAHGRGFAFNPGETVFGTSAPGYAVVLAGLTFLCRPIGLGVDTIGSVLFLLSLALLPMIFAAILRRLGAKQPELIAGAFALLSIPSRWNAEMMGCEQIPMLSLTGCAVLLALDRREAAAGLCAGVAAAFRFDAGLLAAALAIFLYVDRERIPWKFCLSAGVPVLACWTWLMIVFGSIVPVTLEGKRAEIEFLDKSYGSEEISWLIRTEGLWGALIVAALALVGMVAVFRLRGRARSVAWTFGAWIIVHEVFYASIGVPFAPWYQIATYNLLLALAALGVASCSNRVRLPWGSLANVARLGAAVALLLPSSVGHIKFISKAWGRPPDPRIRIYKDVGLAAKNASKVDATIASVEVGALAYFSDRVVVDLAGLLSLESRNARSRNELAAFLSVSSPDFFVDNPTFHSTFLEQVVSSGLLDEKYQPFSSFSRPEYPHAIALLARRSPI